MKSILLCALLLVFNVNSMSFDEYSGNGICMKIKNNTGQKFVLTHEEGVAIAERELKGSGIKKIEKKNIDVADVGIFLFGKKTGSGSAHMAIHLKDDKDKKLLTLSFRLDPHNGRQFHLESAVKSNSVSVGLFKVIGGGGITYQLIIEEEQKAIDMLEYGQQMIFPNAQQERLQKIEISTAR
jgi:hypothetical protein